MPRPDFFLVGAPKCGTTALNQYLAAHPQVFMGKKEQHFFGSDLRPAGYDGPHGNEAAWYLRLFEEAAAGQRVGEASVWYLHSRKAAEEIHAFNPEAKILIMVRNPIDMMYSLYSMFIWVRDLAPGGVIDPATMQPLSFEEALASQEARKAMFAASIDDEMRSGRKERRLFHTDAAQFSEGIRRYQALFGEERVHVIVYDDFRTDTARCYRRVLSFLEVDPGFTPAFQVVNANKRIKSARLNHFLRTHRGNDEVGVLRRIGRWVTPQALRKAVGRQLMRANVQQRPREAMAPATRSWLRQQFEEDVAQLSTLLGRDLTALWLATEEHA